MRFFILAALLTSATLAASDAYPPPRFTDPHRVKKLESTLPEIDRLFQAYATREKIPGMIWGVVIDGRLAHVAWAGVRDRGSNAHVPPATAVRIEATTTSLPPL